MLLRAIFVLFGPGNSAGASVEDGPRSSGCSRFQRFRESSDCGRCEEESVDRRSQEAGVS